MFVARLTAATLFVSACMALHPFTASAQAKKEIRGTPIAKPVKATNAAPTEVKTAATQTASAAPKPAATPVPSKTDGEFKPVSFDLLANFTFDVPDGVVAKEKVGESATQIPADVRALNEKKVALKGFMLPLKVDNGLVTELLIMKDQSMCCYGTVPRINDWVSVKMKGKGVPSVMDQAVTIFGKIRVGEMLENGYLVAIYQMDGEKMASE
jgi:hypothetical protein